MIGELLAIHTYTETVMKLDNMLFHCFNFDFGVSCNS